MDRWGNFDSADDRKDESSVNKKNCSTRNKQSDEASLLSENSRRVSSDDLWKQKFYVDVNKLRRLQFDKWDMNFSCKLQFGLNLNFK